MGKSNSDTKKMIKDLKSIAKSSTSSSKADSDQISVLENINKGIKEGNREKEKAAKGLRGPGQKYLAPFQQAGDSMSNLSSITSKFGKGFVAANLAVGAFGFALDGAIAMVDIMVKAITNTTKSYADAYKAGVSFSNLYGSAESGLKAFTATANSANLTMEELANLSGEYAMVMNQLGIKTFGSVSKEVSKFGSQFGLTAEESAEYLASYLEQQRLQGTLDRIQNSNAAKRAKANLQLTTQFAQTLGISTDAMKEQLAAQSESIDTQRALINVSDASKDALQVAFTGMADGTQQALKEMLAVPEGMEAGSEKYQQIMTLYGQDAAETFANFARAAKNGTLTEENAAKMTDKLNGTMVDAYNRNKDFVNSMTFADASLAELGKEMYIQSNQFLKASKVIDDASTNGFAQMFSVWSDTFKDFKEFFNRLFGDLLTEDFVERINASMKEVQNVLGAFGENLKTSGFIEAIPGLIEKLPPLFAALVKGFQWLGVFMGKVAKDGIMSAIWDSGNISEELLQQEEQKKQDASESYTSGSSTQTEASTQVLAANTPAKKSINIEETVANTNSTPSPTNTMPTTQTRSGSNSGNKHIAIAENQTLLLAEIKRLMKQIETNTNGNGF